MHGHDPSTTREYETGERTYDLYFTAGRRAVFFRKANRGVTLTQDCITWAYDGRADRAPFGNIVEIRLQSGGDWRNITHLCEIVFADRYKLLVRDSNTSGIFDEAQASVYRHFLRDLHGRLLMYAGARQSPPITFSAGYPPRKYQMVVACAVLMALMFVGIPFGLLLYTGEIKTLTLLIVGVLLIWPLKTMMANNRPRHYDAARLPKEFFNERKRTRPPNT